MTEPDQKKPPPFYCPQCGQKHRADLSALVGQAGASMKTSCAGCAIPLSVSLDEDDLPQCVALEEALGESPAAEPADEAPAFKAPVPKLKRGRGGAKRERKPRKKKDEQAQAAPEASGPEAPMDEPAEAAFDPNEPAPAEEHSEELPPRRAQTIEAEFAAGDSVGRYDIEAAIGEGGTSQVYRAYDPTTNRTVAIKVLKQGQSETMRQRFLREIEVQANIRHQNIMPVFDRGALEDGRPFFTMELLYNPWSLTEIVEYRERGMLHRYTTLQDLVELDTLITKILVPVCDGIYVANVENAVIHRDLKPDNVLVDSRTLRPYVIDFGICDVLERKRLGTGPVIPPTAEEAGIVGTPRFLAPEQAKGNTNARTDVWGLGALLHFVSTGEPPIAGAAPITKTELKRRIEKLEEAKRFALEHGDQRKVGLCDEKLGRLQDVGLRTVENIYRDARDGIYQALPDSLPSPLTAVIRKAMAKNRSDRYVNARQLSAELQAWLKGSRVRALTQAGGTAAAVESARRAMRRHLVTAVWILGAVGLGLLLGKGLAGDAEIGPSTRIGDAYADIDRLDKSLAWLDQLPGRRTPKGLPLSSVEAHYFWRSLTDRADAIAANLAKEPASAERAKARERLAFVRGRFAPSRIDLDVPADVPLSAHDVVTDKRVAVRPGENALPPGEYRLQLGSAGEIQIPVRVPLMVREPESRPEEDPALAVYTLPMAPQEVPAGMVLVLEDQVRARDLPFSEPGSELSVRTFLMDRGEVTNSEYAQFLSSLPVEERKARAPTLGFVPDPETGAPVVVDGKQDLPVVGVRPEDAIAFSAWRGQRTGARVRLPREEEWVLAAGAKLGFMLPNDAPGYMTDGDFTTLKPAGAHAADRSPYGVHGMLGNAREMVLSSLGQEDEGRVLVKGAGVGDDPDDGAIYLLRYLALSERQERTGFRCVRELGAAGGEPPR